MADKAILTTRNVTLVSYKLDGTTSSEDTQAAILTDLYTRFRNTPRFKSYDEINKAIMEGEVAVGTFVLIADKSEEAKIVVAKIRATRQN
jgi:predicted solute-binding protein